MGEAVEHRGEKALGLADDRMHFRREHHDRLGELLQHDLARALLLRTVDERPQVADRDRLDPFGLEATNGLADVLFVEGNNC